VGPGGGRQRPHDSWARAVRRLADWLLDTAPTSAGTYIMSTGIVSLGMMLAGQETIAEIVLAACAIGWSLLAVAFVHCLIARPRELWASTAQLAALTAIAGTTVFGSALVIVLGWCLMPLILWIVAAAGWIVVVARILTHLPRSLASGMIFLPAVATQGVSLLASSLAVAYEAKWLLILAFGLWSTGILLYLFIGLPRFDFGRIIHGEGDQWVLGGAVTISAIAGGKLILANESLGMLAGIRDQLLAAETIVWLVGISILPILVGGELAYPRLQYHPSRWATSFPVAMYAASTFVAATALGAPWMNRYFAAWWVWVGLVVWVLTLTGLLRQIARLASGRAAGPTSPSSSTT